MSFNTYPEAVRSDSDEDAFPPSPAVSRRSSRIQLKSASWASWPTKKLQELLTQEGVPVEVGLSRADALQLADTALGEHLHAPLSPTFTPDAAAAGSAAATTTKPGKKRAGRPTTSGPGKRARKAGISVHGILITTPNKSPTRTFARFYTPSPSRSKASAPGWMLSKHQGAFPDGSRPTTRRRSSPRRLFPSSYHPARLLPPPQAMLLACARVPRLLQPPRSPLPRIRSLLLYKSSSRVGALLRPPRLRFLRPQKIIYSRAETLISRPYCYPPPP